LINGEKIPENQTLEAEQAARDLNLVRNWEATAAQPDLDRVQNAVDNMRQAFPQRELPADFIPQLEQAAEQAKQQQSQPQEQQPQVDAQPQQQQPTDGVDPEIAAALQNPKIRAALEAEVQSAEAARVQYAQATAQAAQLAGASLLASFPELANVPTNQLQTAIQVIGARDPQRAQAINAQLERTQALYAASVQAQNAQAQIQAQRAAVQEAQLRQQIAQEDAKFSASIAHEPPEVVQRAAAKIAEIAAEHGVDRAALSRLWMSSRS
jgi:hypothetical protein